MKKIKNKVSKFMAISMIMLVALSSFAFAEGTLKDIEQSSSYAMEPIRELAVKNVIKGDENGYFRPHNTVRRGEMITMIVRALEVDTYDLPEEATFKDVPTDHWAFKYVEAAHRDGIVNGISA
ncbi:MAG: S-layer homology domain-containing protein, partial [Clostridiaceae bacterium]|nr:S-layer homology domain-containing protein [Clostridiaceae bacterium]